MWVTVGMSVGVDVGVPVGSGVAVGGGVAVGTGVSVGIGVGVASASCDREKEQSVSSSIDVAAIRSNAMDNVFRWNIRVCTSTVRVDFAHGSVAREIGEVK